MIRTCYSMRRNRIIILISLLLCAAAPLARSQGATGFRFGQPYYSHLFIDTVYKNSDPYIPCQSVYDVRLAARLGFRYVEANLHATASPGKYLVIHGYRGTLGYQIEDLDGNGTPDEVALVIDLEAKATKQITLTLSEEKRPNPYPARTFAQMLIRDAKKGKHAQAESLTVPGSANVYNLIYGHGPMMESELVGYRIYFNQKQTLDPYGKFIKRLELASCSFYPSDKQLAEGYGDDVLMVGNSCGIGALKGWDGKQATHMEPIASRTERVVSSGPVRAILEVTVKGWSYQGTTLTLTQRYLLYAGHRDLQIDVIASTEEQKEITFATGVQHIIII